MMAYKNVIRMYNVLMCASNTKFMEYNAMLPKQYEILKLNKIFELEIEIPA